METFWGYIRILYIEKTITETLPISEQEKLPCTYRKSCCQSKKWQICNIYAKESISWAPNAIPGDLVFTDFVLIAKLSFITNKVHFNSTWMEQNHLQKLYSTLSWVISKWRLGNAFFHRFRRNLARAYDFFGHHIKYHGNSVAPNVVVLGLCIPAGILVYGAETFLI